MSGIISKSALRHQIKQRLAAMPGDDRLHQSSIITKKVLSSAIFQQSQRICLYLNMEEEVSTHDILIEVLSTGKQCFIPRYTASAMEMLRIKSLEDYDNLPKTKWNIKQPETSEGREEALTSGGLDLMLVPGLAFTTQGHRLGRGKGYYDRYLEKCKESNLRKLVTIGLAFKEQIVDYIPTHEHDFSVDHVFHSNMD